MSTTLIPHCRETVELQLEYLPLLKLQAVHPIVPQVAQYFRQLLEKHPIRTYLKLPSIMELSGLFHCGEMDIYDALYQLKQEFYNYEMHGVDGPILLQDPLIRKIANEAQWKEFSKALLAPLNEFGYWINSRPSQAP
jgi:hypothetical protein